MAEALALLYLHTGHFFIHNFQNSHIHMYLIALGVKVRNMKMDFNAGGTWRRVGWAMKTDNKIYDIFYST